MSNYLSCNCFDTLVGQDTELMAQEAFTKMDQDLDLFTRKETPTSWTMKELAVNYGDTHMAVAQNHRWCAIVARI